MPETCLGTVYEYITMTTTGYAFFVISFILFFDLFSEAIFQTFAL
jgi:hypothetical protein